MPVNYLTESIVSIISWQNIFTIIEIFTFFGYFMILTPYMRDGRGIIFRISAAVNIPILIYLFPTFISFILGLVFSQTQSEYLAFPGAVAAFIALVTSFISFTSGISEISRCTSDPNVSCSVIEITLLIIALTFLLLLIIISTLKCGGYIRYANSIDTSLQYKKMANYQYTEAEEEINNS